MNFLSILFIILIMLLIPTELIRRFLIYKAKKDERKRSERKAAIDDKGNTRTN